MAVDKKISQLASGAPAQAGDEYVVARSGANYKLTLTNIAGNMPATTISSGNLTFSSTGQRITGDMSNATHSSRLLFQNSGANLPTVVGALPNGSSVTSAFVAYGGSTATDTATVSVVLNGGTDARINSGILGTGTYLPMTFYTGGSERMRLDTSGNLGIGTTPSAVLTPKLQVSSAFSAATAGTPYNGVFVESSDAQAADKGGVISLGGLYDASSGPTRFAAIAGLKENGTSGNYAGYLAFYSRANGSSPAERMRIDSSGNVGIGTASPNAKTTLVQGTQTYGFAIQANSSSEAGNIRFTNSGFTAEQALISSVNGGGLTFNTGSSSTERMRIDSSGSVGIGGTAQGNIRVHALGDFAVLGGNANSTAFGATGTVPTSITSTARSFYSSLTTAASFTLSNLFHFQASNVNVGAGATVTNQIGFLASSGLTTATNNYGFYSDIASGSNRWNFYAAGTAQNYFAGNTLIATTTQLLNARLTVNQSAGGSDYGIALQDNSSNQAFIGVGGGPGLYFRAGAGNPIGTLNSSGNFIDASDIAYKTDINPISYGLDTVLALLPKSYKLIANDKPGIGFIAQEMEKIIPEIVSGEKGSKGISYGQLTAVLVKAIQELSAKVAALEAK